MNSAVTRHGWIALVGPEIEENLSLRYLAAALTAQGWRVRIIVLNCEDDLLCAGEQIVSADEPPVLVGLSLAFQWRAHDFLALAAWLREAGYRGHITGGGHFGSFEHARLLEDFPELDSICLHEAEDTVVDLAARVARGESCIDVAGLAVRGEGGKVVANPPRPPVDLARLPLPDRRGEPACCAGHGAAPLVGSRGCYAHCNFCCIAAWHDLGGGRRFRLRAPEDVAAEMGQMQRERGVDIFIFHDDNFFLPTPRQSMKRIHALADALQREHMRPFATVVKARSADVDAETVRLLQERLHCIRVYVGVETDAVQGLETLGRASTSEQNHAAMATLREAGLFACFNLLVFDPDTQVDGLLENLDFMEQHADFPSNFCRTELYAGTPLLQRMAAEGRLQGDYLRPDYRLATPEMERIFQLFMHAFDERNFAPVSLANDLMSLRFDVVALRHFHPERCPPAWEQEARAISAALIQDSVDVMRRLVHHVRTQPAEQDRAVLREQSAHLRNVEARLWTRTRALQEQLARAIAAPSPNHRAPEAAAMESQ
jgi:hypothetical protein